MYLKIFCLVNRNGKVYADGLAFPEKIAERHNVDIKKCLVYGLDLRTKIVTRDRTDRTPFDVEQKHLQSAEDFFTGIAGDARKLITFVEANGFRRSFLYLLGPYAQLAMEVTDSNHWQAQRPLVDLLRDLRIQKHIDGDSFDEILKAITKDHDRRYYRTWATLFADPENRDPIWR